jgi:hypothetical protein
LLKSARALSAISAETEGATRFSWVGYLAIERGSSMCGRISIKTSLDELTSNFSFAVCGGDVGGLGNRSRALTSSYACVSYLTQPKISRKFPLI